MALYYSIILYDCVCAILEAVLKFKPFLQLDNKQR